MSRALLIDDEPSGRDALRALLAGHPSVAIVGEAGTLSSARTLLDTDGYDLVFLDIQLRGGTGFDLVDHVRPGARIIFVTAYDRHALRAFEVNALDYLLKPIDPARLSQALTRLTLPADPAPAVPLGPEDRLFLKLGSGHERLVRLADIRLVCSCENYSEIALGDGKRLLVRKTMKAWEELLPATQFVRIHRQTIVNLAHLARIERASEATSLVHLDGAAEPVVASYRYLPALREQLARRSAR